MFIFLEQSHHVQLSLVVTGNTISIVLLFVAAAGHKWILERDLMNEMPDLPGRDICWAVEIN